MNSFSHSSFAGWFSWFCCAFSFSWAMLRLWRILELDRYFLSVRKERLNLRRVSGVLQELEETLESGILPSVEKWENLRDLPLPWGLLAWESVRELRSRGAAILPTLKRLRSLADHHAEVLSEARAKSAQALGQVLVCAILVPIFGGALYLLLPGVAERPVVWILCCLIALLVSGCGAVWLLSMTHAARWAGLLAEQRNWVLAAQCMGERVLALVRSGNPPDLAWSRAMELLTSETPVLALHWGYSVFETPKKPRLSASSSAASAILEAGSSMRKAIQVSLMEGRPCTERVESILLAFRQELRALIDRELGLLATRALKPLFIFVAPAIFGLLGAGVWLMWQGVGIS